MRASLVLLGLCTLSLGRASALRRDEEILPNDNRKPAGVFREGVLVVRLEARTGVWHPNGDDAPGAALPAFAEARHAPQIPGPLIRVRAGSVAQVSVRNRLPNDTLVVRGLADRVGQRAGPPDSGIRLAPGADRELRLRFESPGTYYYYGTTAGREVVYRTGTDAQLTGAIIVDPVDAPPPPDRILVIGMWTDTVARAYTKRHRILAVVNGRSWPKTERFQYQVGDTVRWRVINASGDNHPMHLHGFYFRVDSRGDGRGDTTYRAGEGDRVVTESMSPGTTMRMTWVPERAGNWLFHCHIPEHFGRRGALGMPPEPIAAAHAGPDHAMSDMNGLVVGIEVRPRTGLAERIRDDRGRRRLRLIVRRNAGGSDTTPYFGFALQDGSAAPPADSGLRLGPPLVLEQGQPVGITVVNELAEPTAVHWHGIELESYYDGVAGWSGAGQRLAPLIAPRDSFEARFAPPHAGTFIYHTHVDELRQEPAGLAGPIIVLAPGARWDPSTDHPVMITSPWSWEQGRRAVLVNGSPTPPPIELRAGVAHRFRIVNMTTRRPALRLELRRDTTLLAWRELAKDGNDFSEARRAPRRAMHQISIGETFDVEITPDTPGNLRLEVRLGSALPEHPVFATLPLKVVDPGPRN